MRSSTYVSRKPPLRGVSLRIVAACVAVIAAAAFTAADVANAQDAAIAQDAPAAPIFDVDRIRLELQEDEDLSVRLAEDFITHGTLDSVAAVENAGVIGEAHVDSSRSLRVAPAPEASGRFALRFYASNPDTSVFADVSGVIAPRTDLPSGVLQSIETRHGRPGVVRVYTTERELLAEVRAGSTGRFPGVQLPVDRKEYVVQAVITKGDEVFGYVRTIAATVPRLGDDIDLPAIRTIPFDGLAEVGMDSSAFREHVLMVTRDHINRWDLDALRGIYIVDRTPRGRFDPGDIQQIKDLFTASDAVRGFVRDREFRVVDGRSAGGSRPVRINGSTVVPERGWIVVVPDTLTDGSSSSSAEDVDDDGTYDRGYIRLNPARAARFGSTARLVTYEAGRVLGMAGDSDPLNFAYTMMVPGAGPQVPEKPTPIDRKTGAILYDDGVPVNSDLDLLLGIAFDEPVTNLTSQ